jgi:hypothetical protein
MRRQRAELIAAIGVPALGLLIYLVAMIGGCRFPN